MRNRILTQLFVLFSMSIYAQNAVLLKGTVNAKEDGSAVNTAVVSVEDNNKTVIVNNKGEFVLEVKQKLPVNVLIKAVGYKDYKYTITSKEEKVTFLLIEDITSLDEIVLSASRTPERVFESPVSVERIGTVAIETTTAPTFYDGLENLKGVDVNTSSLTFKTVNTRGFATFGNTRFIQLVDGMDNSSPGLGFALGNLIGLNELDIQSVELLPGASSALYGANAFNGIMFMRSKSPFTHEGVSVYGKAGVTNSDASGVNEFIDAGVRVAKKINDHFAVKFTTSILKATDWFATDTRNIDDDGNLLSGGRYSTLADNYNGVNIYGDEFTNPTDLGFGKVTRTGYSEQDLVNPDTDNFRAALSLHWRPFKDDKDTEVIYNSKYGTGNTIYQAASRYAMRNFVMHQHKLELRSKHLMLRSYVTFEDAGDSYNIAFAGVNTLRAQNQATVDSKTGLSVDELWFGTYGNALAGLILNVTPGNREIARRTADNAFRTDPNSAEFSRIFNSVISNSNLTTGGAKFVDTSRLYHSDFNYNFKDKIEFAEVQIGASARRYMLNSDGTLFTDTEEGEIVYDEYGIYTQLQKKLLDDRLKLTGSLRYDKAQNFKGNFSPRASVSFSIDEEKNHNIRASFQTGFRNPTTQEQYIGLDIGRATLVGSASDNLDRYSRDVVNSAGGSVLAGSATSLFTGRKAYENAFTLSSAEEFGALAAVGDFAGAVAKLRAAEIDLVKPEQVISYELGYRGRLTNHTVLDFSAYYNKYNDFISLVTVLAPNYGNVNLSDVGTLPVSGVGNVTLPKAAWALINGDRTAALTYTNTNADVSSYGVNVGLETQIFEGYNFGINYALAKQDFDQSDDPDFETQFNTPKHKVKMSFGKTNFYKGLGFGLNVRWQDAFYWQSTFVDGMISARTLLDAQFMYNIEKWNSKIKVGGANLLGNEYESAPGSGTIGSQLYGSWTYNF